MWRWSILRERPHPRQNPQVPAALGASNEHEAAAALRQAHKLMREHGISECDVELADVVEASVSARTAHNPPIWNCRLAAVISDAFGCERFLQPHRGSRWGWTFVGVGSAPEIATYAFVTLFRQVDRARKDYYRRSRARRTNRIRRADLFAEGWVRAVDCLVKEFARPSPEIVGHYMVERHSDLVEHQAKQRGSLGLRDLGGGRAAPAALGMAKD
jgi:hypothetical protein